MAPFIFHLFGNQVSLSEYNTLKEAWLFDDNYVNSLMICIFRHPEDQKKEIFLP